MVVEAEVFLRESPLNLVTRWEILFPNSRKPWLALDFAALRRGLEESGEAFSHVWAAWVWSSPEEILHGCAVAEPGYDYARTFHGLLHHREARDCLLAIHDGSDWVRWQGLRMRLEYSQERVVWLEPDGRVSDLEGLPDTSAHLPFWVDVYRGVERLVRWRQHEMKLDFRLKDKSS